MTNAPGPTDVLQARGLHRFYRRGDEEVAALLDVSFRVEEGEMVAITGPSGSGKSTLLGLLAGLDQPDGGSVWIAGQRFSHQSPREQARRRAALLGILTQSSGLVEHLSVAGNVRLAASLRAASRSTVSRHRKRDESLELLEKLGVRSIADARPSTLSGGETARVNLAVAMIGDPLVLLADEPTAEVSRDEEQSVLQLLRRARPARGATVVVTHSAVVAGAADRVLHMTDGRLA